MTKNAKLSLRSIGIVGGGIAAMIVIATCSGDPVTGTGGRPQISHRPSLTLSMLSAEQLGRVQAAKQRGSWVGQLHTTMMIEITTNRSRWIAASHPTPGQICAGVAQLSLKTARLANAHLSVKPSDEDDRANVRALMSRLRSCKNEHSLSIFEARYADAPRFGPTAPQASDSDVSEDFVAQLYALRDAVLSTDGSPAAVQGAVDNALASAANGPQANLNALAGTGSLTVASATYIQTVNGGSTPYYDPINDTTYQYPMSLFSPRPWSWWSPQTLLALTAVDLVGCITGEVAAIQLGIRNESTLYAQCGIWGVGTSAATITALAITS